MSFNKLILIGNLGRDPEVRHTPQGKQVATFSVATTEKRKGQNDVTTWVRVTAWERLSEIAVAYLSKGSQVYIEGRLSTSEYTDRDGNKRFSLEVRATDLQLLGSREERVESADESTTGMKPDNWKGSLGGNDFTTGADDDVPF
jgi:single-strand DNA-binding protein